MKLTVNEAAKSQWHTRMMRLFTFSLLDVRLWSTGFQYPSFVPLDKVSTYGLVPQPINESHLGPVTSSPPSTRCKTSRPESQHIPRKLQGIFASTS